MNTDGTATSSGLAVQVGPDGGFKSDARLLLFTHGTLIVVLAFLLFGYILPLGGAFIWRDIPESFLFVLNISIFVKDNALFLAPILLLTLWADARGYQLCCTRYGRDIGRCWFGVGVGLLAAIIIFCLWSLAGIVRD